MSKESHGKKCAIWLIVSVFSIYKGFLQLNKKKKNRSTQKEEQMVGIASHRRNADDHKNIKILYLNNSQINKNFKRWLMKLTRFVLLLSFIVLIGSIGK